MMDSRKSLLLIFGLIVTLLLAACAADPVSVAPSATPSSELSAAASTETPAPSVTPSPAEPATQAPTAPSAPEPAATETPAPSLTPTPSDAATQAPSAPSAPEPAATEPHSPTTSSEVPRLSARELKGRFDSGEAILVVDARTTAEFEGRHIPGAISVPLSVVESHLDEFPREQEIVFY